VKKIIIIMITLTVILTGCSSDNKSSDNTVQKTVNDTVTENTSSSNNQQSQSQPESTSQGTNDTNSDTKPSLLDNIDTSKSLFERGYHDYEGIIGNNMSIQMSVYQLGKDIVGSYFYDSQRKEIKLKGKAGEKEIVLYEYDEAGKNTGIFKGTMNTVDKIEGTWISSDNKKSYPFTLSLKSIITGAQYGKRYSAAVGTESDQDVENYVSEIQNYVVNDNSKQLAEQVSYPIKVKINNKVAQIENEDDFIKNYDKIFDKNFKKVISNASTKYMFVNYKGIMFGANLNNIWISGVMTTGENSKLMIIGINN
jgi:hypothetical protein